MIAKESGVAYGSVRNTIRIFVKDNILLAPMMYRRGSMQGFTFKFSKRIKLYRQASGQTPEKPSSLIRKKERFLKNLSFSDFWLDQGLTQQKLDAWMKEFNFTEEEWEVQLIFGANEPKVKNADNPIKYFYKSLKQGGLTRPNGFEFPEERLLRIRKEEMEARKKLVEEEKKLREQEKTLADEEAFLVLLKDKETVTEAITELEDGQYLTSKVKLGIKQFNSTGQITDALENKLRIWFRSDGTDKTKN
ncbi:hypothetical protein MTBBW1_2710001 [Desulfamplus magnetovallimortis]|uniref:Uncharacterized protein n=2 Tax=Desulfamplus magnetovallimortis TaxID=1246637 RepID=A0A1W1HF45_9BACT|nr:hypothetical protein MTBBW1_2710001 [Desulfamplus magnetovallimortis]